MKPVPVRPIHRLGLPLGLGLGLVLAVLFMAAQLQAAAARPGTIPPEAPSADTLPMAENITFNSGPAAARLDVGVGTLTEVLWGQAVSCSAGAFGGTITDSTRPNFDNLGASCDLSGGGVWTYTQIMDTGHTSISAITLTVRLMFGKASSIAVSAFNGSTWTPIGTVDVTQKDTWTTQTFAVSSIFANPTQINNAQVRLGLASCNGQCDLTVDQVRLAVKGPVIEVSKSVDPTSVAEPGGAVTFTVAVTNIHTGQVFTLTGLTDSVYGNLNGQGNCGVPQTIQPSAPPYTCTFVGSVSGNAGENKSDTVTASGTHLQGGTVSASASATVTISNSDPVISVSKTANPTDVLEGGQATFTVVVTNESVSSDPVTVTGLVDDIHGDLDGQGDCGVPQTMIQPGASYSCAFTATVDSNASESETDTVTVTAEDDEGSTDQDTASATVTTSNRQPVISVSKTVSPTAVGEPGGEVTFTVVVTNESVSSDPVTVTGMVDVPHGDLDGQGDCGVPQTIQPGSSYSCAFTAILSGDPNDSQTDTVTVVAKDDEDSTVQDTATATATITDVLPSIAVSKSAQPDSLPEPGGTVTFTVVITNDSVSSDPVTLTGLVDDPYGDLNGQGTCATGPALSPGEAYTCNFTGTVPPPGSASLAGAYTDMVTATVSDDEGNSVPAAVTATVALTDVPPSIVVSKSALPDNLPEPGGTITFTVRVTNTLASVEPVTVTTLMDDIYGDLTDPGNSSISSTTCIADTSIPVGNAYTCNFTALISGTAGYSETDIVTVEVEDDDGSPGSDSDSAKVTVTPARLCSISQMTRTPDDVTNEQPSISAHNQLFRIAFVSNATDTLKAGSLAENPEGNREVFVYDGATGAITAATRTGGGATNEQPAISGDGNIIAFASDATLVGNDGNQEIFNYGIPTSRFFNVTNTDGSIVPGFNLAPSASYTGARIAFVSEYNLENNPDLNPEIFVYNGSPFHQVSAGAYHTCGLKANGRQECWGYNYYGQAPSSRPGPFRQISAGRYHTCALQANGSVTCWGLGSPLQLHFAQATAPSGDFGQVSAGGYHTCGVRTNGRLECWGYDGYLQVSGPNASTDTFNQVGAGGYHTCGVRTDGRLVCWGYDGYLQVSGPNTSIDTFDQVSTGLYHTCGLRTDGRLECWGYDGYGQSSPPSGPSADPIDQATTTTNVTNEQPAISSDGQTIAFVSDQDGNREIFVYSSGTGISQVTATGGGIANDQPSISHDGQTIAFVSDRDGNPEIYVYDVTSAQLVTVTTTSVVTNGQPAISGDGRRIAFVSNGDLDPTGQNTDGNREIFVAELSGTTVITFVQVTSTTSPVDNSHPSINRLGGAIAFVSTSDLQPSGRLLGGNPEIFLARCDTDLPPVALEVKKELPTQAFVGGWFPYTIVFTNTSTTDSALELVLTDELEGADSSLYVDQPGCSHTSPTVACSFDELAPNSSQTITIWAQKATVGWITNTVEVEAANPNASDSDTISSYAGAAADLRVEKDASSSTVTVGEPITFVITVTNKFGLPTGVTLVDTLEAEAGISNLSISPPQPSAGCVPSDVDSSTRIYTCGLSGTLEGGEATTLTMVITPQQEGVITNTASVTSSPPLDDPDSGDNEDHFTVGPRGGVYLPIILKNQ
jgi:uncharacterized repeat protein (TIGR01451 family)